MLSPLLKQYPNTIIRNPRFVDPSGLTPTGISLDINRFFTEIENTFNNIFNYTSNPDSTVISVDKDWPKHDIYTNKTEFLIVMDIPSIYKKDDINVKIKNNQLFIIGKKSNFNEKYNEYESLYKSRKCSSFSKKFSLDPNIIDVDKINAKFENGVIEIKIPIKNEKLNTEVEKNLL